MAFSKKIRQQVYDKCNGHCAYCGREIAYKDMQVDHVTLRKENDMAFVAVDKDGSEWIYQEKPFRDRDERWAPYDEWHDCYDLPKGSIRKLIGRELTWLDEPVELKGE